MAFLLDTNVLSELRKGSKAHPHVRAWAVAHRHQRHAISVLSLGEIRRGIESLRGRAPDQCAAFEKWLDQLRTVYHSDILPVSSEVADCWGRLNAQSTRPVIDGLIAATAQVHRLILVTRNAADFPDTVLINPFEVDQVAQ